MTNLFTRASEFKDRHGLIISLVGGPSSGKTYSGMRLAKGIAEAQGKRWAVVDTEGGRTLHLKELFDFDVLMMTPPHRPKRYLELAQNAERHGYGALLIDSFSAEWRGLGGVLDWTDTNVAAYIDRQRAIAEEKNWRFNEETTRAKGMSSARIQPNQSHKYMLYGLLTLKMPIVLSIRAEMTFDPEKQKEALKVHTRNDILFEVTCSFQLAIDKKGVIDLSKPETHKVEGVHADIFKDGQQLCEDHGRLINAWASADTGRPASTAGSGRRSATETVAKLKADIDKATSTDDVNALLATPEIMEVVKWLVENRKDLHKELFDHANARRAALRIGGAKRESSSQFL